jgi:lysophospholipase
MHDLLFESPDNPMPANGFAAILTMRDGIRLRYARFSAEARPLRGTVIIVQGRNESIEKYFETIRDLSRRGFGSALFDLRGQGGSDRMLRDPQRGHIDDFRHYVDDLEPFFEQVVLPDCRGPYYLLAHSTGALVALLASPVLANRVQRMVLTAPLLELAGLPFSMTTTYRIASAMHALGLGSRYLGGGPRKPEPTPFAVNVLTTDPVRYRRNVDIVAHHPRLGLGGPTASWIRAACIAIRRARDPEFVARLHVPMLIVAAGNDKVVDTPAIEHYARRLRSGSQVTIDGARHELLQEADIYREQLLAAIDAFLVPGTPA